MKHYLYNLVVEVTRKCNMGCAHCLRGDAQNLDIHNEYIRDLLKDVDNIGNITFTGGEPSLNLSAIESTLRICEELDISVDSFYIVTNGKSNILPLAIVSLKWYAYCNEKEMCGLALSKDMFHEDIDSNTEELLRGLAFFREDKFVDFNKAMLVYSGRAEDLGGFDRMDVERHNEELVVEDWDGIRSIESMIYLAANGEIRTNCDAAYDDDSFTIGNIREDSLTEIVAAQLEEMREVA